MSHDERSQSINGETYKQEMSGGLMNKSLKCGTLEKNKWYINTPVQLEVSVRYS